MPAEPPELLWAATRKKARARQNPQDEQGDVRPRPQESLPHSYLPHCGPRLLVRSRGRDWIPAQGPRRRVAGGEPGVRGFLDHGVRLAPPRLLLLATAPPPPPPQRTTPVTP